MPENAPKLKAEELTEYLNAKIRQEARWKIERKWVPGIGSSVDPATGAEIPGTPGFYAPPTDEAITKVAVKVYDDIVLSTGYDSNLLQATRAIEGGFTTAYIRGVLTRAVSNGMLECEDVIDRLLTEAAKKGKLPPLGSGGRFKKLVAKFRSKGVSDPAALAAHIGRKKYGKKRFQQMSRKGKKG